MKIYILFIGFLLMAYCPTEKNDSDSEISDADFAVENIDDYLSDEDVDTSIIRAREEHKIRMTKKSFKFICTANCDSDPSYHGPSQESINKYGIKKPFILQKTLTDSICIIQFKVIDDCCQEFVGDVEIVSNNMILNYQNISGLCDCYCEYEYKFEVKIHNQKIKKILLNGEMI